ncbi:MAG: hypothetical protein AAGJ18_30105 [Bacteroidota bacterium]
MQHGIKIARRYANNRPKNGGYFLQNLLTEMRAIDRLDQTF